MTAAFDWLQAVVIASLAGSAAGGLLWLWFRCVKRMSPTWQYYLWFAALLACVLPVRIAWKTPAATAPIERVTVYLTETATTPLPPPATADVPQVAWGDVFAVLWLAVAAVLYGRCLLCHWMAARRLRRTTVASDCPLLSEFTKRHVRVRVGEEVSSPLLLGLWRPTLYLPAQPLSEEQLRHVLAHETVHLHRGDLWLKQAALWVRCLCWFNPAVYGIYRRFTALCEISCDVAAVKKTGGDAAPYLSTVLYLMCAGRGRPDRLSTAMTGDSRRVKERFRAVSGFRSRRAVTAIAVIAAAVMLTGAVCVGGVAAGREHTASPLTAVTLPLTTPQKVETGREDTTPFQEETVPPPVLEGSTLFQGEAEMTEALQWPCLTSNTAVTSAFGYRWGVAHRGIDIEVTMGDPVGASAAGEVIACVKEGYNGGYGLAVTIDHGNGIQTVYAHLDSVEVEVGALVERGERIGTAGMTGNTTGPCLHFEVRADGVAIDPFAYLVGVSREERVTDR